MAHVRFHDEDDGEVEMDIRNSPHQAADRILRQTHDFTTQGTIWYEVTRAHEKEVMNMISKDPSILDTRGNVGELPVHLLSLMHQPAHDRLLRSILDKYPQYIEAAYEGTIYGGETLLHIEVINRNFETVRYLVEKSKNLLKLRTTGDFFSYDKKKKEYRPCAYGDIPLGFAACTNNRQIFDYLLEQGSDFWYRDHHGNSLLHLAVIHNLFDMYDYILSINKKYLEEKGESKSGDSKAVNLEKVQNYDGYTPLTLAVALHRAEFFTHIWEGQKVVNWVYGPVTSARLPLEEIDSVCAGTTPDGKKYVLALELMVEKQYKELLKLPRMVELLHQKWTRYAKFHFYRRFIISFVYAVILTVAIILRSPNPDKQWYIWSDADTIARFILEILTLIGFGIKFLREIREFIRGMGPTHNLRTGIQHYYGRGGYVFLENFVSTLYIVSFILALANRVAMTPAYPFFAATTVIIVWSYIVTLFVGFEITGPIIIMVYNMIVGDVVRFLILYLCLLVGFTTAFYTLENSDQSIADNGFQSWFDRLRSLFMVLFSNFDFDEFNGTIDPNYRPFSTLLLLLHIILLTILLLNLLIAMMGETFQSTKAEADQVWHMCYAFMILSVEAEMSESDFAPHSVQYWLDTEGTRWLLTEEINKEKYTNLFQEEKKNEEEIAARQEKKEREILLSTPLNQMGLDNVVTSDLPIQPRRTDEPQTVPLPFAYFQPTTTTSSAAPPSPIVTRPTTTFTENVSRPATPGGREVLHEF